MQELLEGRIVRSFVSNGNVYRLCIQDFIGQQHAETLMRAGLVTATVSEVK